jgi:hypothetical protein
MRGPLWHVLFHKDTPGEQKEKKNDLFKSRVSIHNAEEEQAWTNYHTPQNDFCMCLIGETVHEFYTTGEK